MKDHLLHAFTSTDVVQFYRYGNGQFFYSEIPVNKKKSNITLESRSFFAGASWLENANFDKLEDYQARYHRFFFKEFSLDNPSGFRKATLYIYPEAASCLMNINEKWIKQEVRAGQLNAIDVTGYVAKGNNILFFDFPYIEGKARFAARIIVEYINYDRVEYLTDESWLTTDMYTYPSTTRSYNQPVKPVVTTAPDFADGIEYEGFAEWDLNVPYGAFDGLSALYGHLFYSGDRAELYDDHYLCFDDYNFNLPWQFGLQRINRESVEGKTFRLVIYPLLKDAKIFFDLPVDDYNKAKVKRLNILEEQVVIIN
jgi:hypothetical protein